MQHFDNDFIVGLGALRARVADENAVAEYGTIDPDVAVAVALEISADKLLCCPLDDPIDHADRRSDVGLPRDPHSDLVARGGIFSIFLMDKDFRSSLAVDSVGPHEAIAAPRP
ncbi:MAG TPA: hypothetical protein VKT80_04735, partial [Chloroflexota bacterium]|nr:hypothetical protein [Chloroflexota bacterium]